MSAEYLDELGLQFSCIQDTTCIVLAFSMHVVALNNSTMNLRSWEV